jgi:hypothetical protein
MPAASRWSRVTIARAVTAGKIAPVLSDGQSRADRRPSMTPGEYLGEPPELLGVGGALAQERRPTRSGALA